MVCLLYDYEIWVEEYLICYVLVVDEDVYKVVMNCVYECIESYQEVFIFGYQD